jgi:cyclase
MLKKRLIAVLILRDGQVVQSIRFKHTNVIHYDPVHAMEAFNKWSVDEIVLLNVSRSADSRDAFAQAVEHVSKHCFVPLSVGGWITDAGYARGLLSKGADKLVLNTAFADDPALVQTLSRRFGNLRAIRPGHGLPPKHLKAFLGRPARRSIARGTPLDWPLAQTSD